MILFRKTLRSERQNAKLSQRQLGELAGLSQGTLSDIENGAREPGLGLVIRLARALQLQPADLLAHSEPATPYSSSKTDDGA